MTSIIGAVEQGNLADVQRLLLAGEDPSALGNWAIRRACVLGHAQIARLLLLDKRVDPTLQNNYCMRHAILNGYTEIVLILVADGRASWEEFKGRELRTAFLKGHREIVDLLEGLEPPSPPKSVVQHSMHHHQTQDPTRSE